VPDDLVVAVLGTGTMGAAMAANIAKAGLGLRVWNREPELAAPLGELGAVIGSTPAQASQGADVILTPLANESVVGQVMDQARDGIDKGAAWLQVCTVSPDGSRRLAQQAAQLGVGYVEAPLLGTKEHWTAATYRTRRQR
jgi:3-hydroxyisobutyrate dehydrogenase